jgi:hypothetical protein
VTYFYRAYGITLTSDTPLLGLRQEPPNAKPSDLELTVGPEPDWVREVAHLSFRLEHPRRASEEHDLVNLTSLGAGDYYRLEYVDGTQFVMDRDAKHLWGTFQPPLTLEDFATYLSGPVLGFVLRRRGVTALHSSALCIDGNAVILCGESESGKSTTLAAMALHKFAVLTEDISPIKEEGGTLCVEPGYPRVCLWPDAVQMLFGASDALPLLTPTWDKRFLPLDGVRGSFEPQKQALGVIYLLSPRTDNVKAPYIEEYLYELGAGPQPAGRRARFADQGCGTRTGAADLSARRPSAPRCALRIDRRGCTRVVQDPRVGPEEFSCMTGTHFATTPR